MSQLSRVDPVKSAPKLEEAISEHARALYRATETQRELESMARKLQLLYSLNRPLGDLEIRALESSITRLKKISHSDQPVVSIAHGS